MKLSLPNRLGGVPRKDTYGLLPEPSDFDIRSILCMHTRRGTRSKIGEWLARAPEETIGSRTHLTRIAAMTWEFGAPWIRLAARPHGQSYR
jgi:hypothetical protein